MARAAAAMFCVARHLLDSRETEGWRIIILSMGITSLYLGHTGGLDGLGIVILFRNFWLGSRMRGFECRMQAAETRCAVCIQVTGVSLNVEV